MDLGVIGQAVGMFAVTNIDDLLILALFFGRARGAGRIVVGQYLGFGGILVVSVVGALGATLLPESVRPWLGLLPIALGIKAFLRRDDDDGDPDETGPGVLAVAGVTLANGGDNVGVYVPVFSSSGHLVVYVVVFLVLVGVWCAAGRFLATRPVVARALARWGHVLLPVVLVGVGVLILVEGFF
ncbi:cadmium resistance transporter [Umezawaea sp. Da 62-37]|uniref:cadmium resistance transporter n=1 Tax=Umezawaea sp. Da 62-37 TaxID=3075927 RepID=UPI0028F71C21|nr:cadmium resistance transporter [Umezawaea sp. Da 62-37]WNV86784.1 cadmium resistance transporter [Umezawaea sp. Da 62-37]